MGNAAQFDILRSLAFGSISGTYALIGTPLIYAANAIRITNNTDGDMFISDDGINNKLFVPATSFVLYDISSNKNFPSEILKKSANTQFYVKQSTAPTKGDVYVEVIYEG